MFMNRWLCRKEIVEDNDLTRAEAEAVFRFLKPLRGAGKSACYLETEADEAVGLVRRGRPLQSNPLSIGEKESQMIASAGDFNALVTALTAQTQAISTLVATLAPETPELVGTDYLAQRLGFTPQWVAKMAERGEIPKHCIAPKISGGRIWKFHREKIDAWLRDREQG